MTKEVGYDKELRAKFKHVEEMSMFDKILQKFKSRELE